MFERLVERLKEAVQATAIKRDSLEELTEYKEIIEDMQESQIFRAYMGEVQGRKYIQRRNRIC